MKIFKKSIYGFLSILCLLPLAALAFNSLYFAGQMGVENYLYALLQSPELFKGFWNSILYTAIILTLNIPISLLYAYGFTRYNFRGKNILMAAIIIALILPFQATLVPQYIMLNSAGLLDNALSVLLPNIFTTFGVFLMIQQLNGFDRSIYAAARVDGVSDFRVFFSMVVPISKPLIVALCVLSFANFWSMVEQPTAFLETSSLMPLPVMLAGQTGGYGMSAWGILMCVLPICLYSYSNEALRGGISLFGGGDNSGGKKFGNKLWLKIAAYFMLFMIICTLATQKIEYIMMPQVSHYPLEDNGSLSGGFSVPVFAVEQMGSDSIVYAIEPSEQSQSGYIAKMITVYYEPEDIVGNYVTVGGALEEYMSIVCHRSKPITAERPVRIVGEGLANE